MPGFGPAAEVLLVRQKDPKPLTPSPVTSEWADASHGRAGQLAVPVLSPAEGLKQGPPRDESVRPGVRVEGVEQCEGYGPKGIPCGVAASTGMIKNKKPMEIICNHYKK